MPLDLLVPGLLPPPQAPESARRLRLPRAERWLARAERSRAPHTGAEAWLAARFGIDGRPPVAAVTLAADLGARDGHWLRADPVHLRLGTDSAALYGPEVLAMGAAEARALAAALQAHFAADGLEFAAPVPTRWYVRVPAGELPVTTPLDQARGRDVFGLLPRGAGRINWAGAITEAQMVLASHAVNAAREEAGQPPVNSVWFWGEGAAPGALATPYSQVLADGAFARGLALLAGVPARAAPAGFAQLAAECGAGDLLVVDERLAQALYSGLPDAWGAAALALERDWFAHLGAAIARFGGVRLVLPGAESTLVATLTARARWRWLRPRRPLSSHA